jgi:organic radical activating enzyme
LREDSEDDDDEDVYLIEKLQHVGYKIYLHTSTDQPEWHKYKMKPIRKIYSEDERGRE